MEFEWVVGPNVTTLTPRWWMLVVRGVAAMLFGVLAIASPGSSVLALGFLFGAYAFVDGAFNLVLAARRPRAGQRWGSLVFEGLVSVAASVLTFAWPGITTFVLLGLIAFRAVLIGIAELAAAVGLRRQIDGEWFLATAGVLSIGFGALVFAYPRAGLLAVLWIIGSYAMMFGALLVGLGFRLKTWRRRTERAFPTRGTPTAA